MHRWFNVRCSVVKIFDRLVKVKHKERCCYNVEIGMGDEEPPVVGGITTHLLDRLEDTTRTFHRVLLLGNYPSSVLKRIGSCKAGVTDVFFVEASETMRSKIKSVTFPKVRVHVMEGDDENIPLEKESVDLVINNLALHWVNDLQGCLKQCRSVLKPDGLFLATMMGGSTLPELRQCFSLAEQERKGGVSPRLSPLVSVNDAGRLLSDAGFKLTSVDVDNIIMKYRNAWDLVHHLRVSGENNACIQRQNTLDLDTALAMSSIYQHRYADSEDWISASLQAIYMIGWSPGPGQQQAAPRGSADVSLEDLDSVMELNFSEIPSEESDKKQKKD